jgi:hypothetical protein
MLITFDIKHRCFQQNKWMLTVREFSQLLRSPFDIGRSAVHKAVSAFMHTW